jgi:Thrombospondin type 3 repeat
MKKIFLFLLLTSSMLLGSLTTATSASALTPQESDRIIQQLHALVIQLQKQIPNSQVLGEATTTVTTVIPAGTTVITSAISQYGITWFFASPVTAGVFANGDFWVRGPVTITKITPDFDGSLHGWEVNPVNGDRSQGFDSRGSRFNASKVPSLPYLANGGQSIVKGLSNIKGSGGCIDDNHPCNLKTVAVLTVLSDIPEGNGASFFRPPYVGSDKKLYRIDSLRTDLLPSLPLVAGAPSLATVESQFKRVQFDHISAWSTRYLHPELNMPGYGSDVARRINEAALRLMLNDSVAAKMPALIAFTQQGIDFYHMLKTGSTWNADGGHFIGRKLPIVFTAVMLNDGEMKQALKNAPTNVFSEDGTTYMGKTGVPLYGSESASNHEKAYWDFFEQNKGSKILRDPYGYHDSGGYQFCCTAMSSKASALAAMLLPDGRAVWDHEPFFLYADRYVGFGTWTLPDPCAFVRPTTLNGTCVPGGPRFASRHGENKDSGYYGSAFVDNVWKAYRTKSGMPALYVPVVTTAPTTTPTAPTPTPTVTLTAANTSIANGGSTTLTWSSQNATACTASGAWTGAKALTGTQSTGALARAGTQTYTLTCTGAGGTTSRDVTVTVAAQVVASSPAPTLTLTTALSSVNLGSGTTLSWSSQNATSCTASGGWTGGKTLSGTQSTGLLTNTQTYTLTCTGAGGTVAKSVSVGVTSAPLVTPPATAIDTPYKIGNRVQMTKNVNVRTNGLISTTTLIGVNPAGSVGTLKAGPTQSVDRFGTIIWFNVNFDQGFDGWVGADNFKLLAPVVAPPASTTTIPTATDADGDTVPDSIDNCPTKPNTNQLNFDGDSKGDGCDNDDDNDGIRDTKEKPGCILNPSTTCGSVVASTTMPAMSTQVTTTDTLRVRATANGAILGTQSKGAIGTADTTKRQTVSGTVWVYVDFATGLDGYVSEAYLATGRGTVTDTQALMNRLLARLAELQAALAALRAQ